MDSSVLTHGKLSRNIGFGGDPKSDTPPIIGTAPVLYYNYMIIRIFITKHEKFSLVAEYPSCRQMTIASLVPNLLLHTVPHALLMHTSTRPIALLTPPTTLTSPLVQFPAGVVISIKIYHSHSGSPLSIRK